MTPNLNILPDIKVSIKQTFGIETELEVSAFSKKNKHKFRLISHLAITNIGISFDTLIVNNNIMDRPKCGCGNTQNPDGYCDGSHLKNN